MTLLVGRVGLVLVAVLVVQTTALTGIRVFGVAPEALLLVAVAAGVTEGPERGAVTAFAAGLLADLYVHTPFGLSALVYTVVGWSVGVLQGNVLRSSRWLHPAIAAAGSAAGVVLFALLGAVLGAPHLVSPRLLVVATVVAALNAVLSPVVLALVRWAFATAPDSRLAVR